jgi:putative component of toxin-antitoxin plasmid stabilization module
MPSGDRTPLRWDRPSQFLKELRKLNLSRDEAATVTRVMARYAEGRALRRDHKILRGGVEELRIEGNRRTFRVYFTKVEDGLVLLCLHAHAKKKDNDRDAVDLAVERRRAHLDGRWP